MASITFENVSKQFDDFTAVKNLNLSIDDGEFLVFVGPSGCGKTTSLRLLAGLETITSGHLYLDDRIVNKLPPKERNIAMVFQSYALYPHLSVYENMAFSLQLQGKSKSAIRRRVETAADQLGIAHLLERKPKELSGGQRQRVAVGRAIVREPSVFLMDEPLSNLDAKLRVQARTEISKLHAKLQTTFVYVTHDQVEAMTMGTRIAVMNHGILQQIDSPENLYNYPQNVFVAGFIGSPAMNFFRVHLIRKDAQLFLENEDFSLPIPESLTAKYEQYPQKEYIFGIRPENIHDPQYEVADIMPIPVKAEVSVREMMGNEIILYVNTMSGEEFVARVDPRSPLKAGDKINLTFDMSHIHLFDTETEVNITL